MLNWKRTPGTVKKRDRGEVTVFERRRERKRKKRLNPYYTFPYFMTLLALSQLEEEDILLRESK